MYGDHKTLFLRNYSALGSLIILTWEYIATLPLEYRFIWRSSKFTLPSFIYLFSRYFFIGVQLINFGVVIHPLSRFPVPESLCRVWAGCMTAAASASLMALNVVIVSRVYDLYGREWKIGVFVLGLLCFQFMFNTWFQHTAIQDNTFDYMCNIIGFDKKVVGLICNTMTTQTILWGLVANAKQAGGLPRRTRRSTLLYEVTYAYALVLALTIILTPLSLIDDVVRPGLILLWPQTFISTVTCRMILNGFRQEAREPQGLAVIFPSDVWAASLSESDSMSQDISDCENDQESFPGSSQSLEFHVNAESVEWR